MSTERERAAAFHRLHSRRAYDVVRENGFAPLEPAQVAIGPIVVLAGDRNTAIRMRVAGVDESEPVEPILVRPAYRPEPRGRVSIDELIWSPSYTRLQSCATWALIVLAASYFVGHAIAAVAAVR